MPTLRDDLIPVVDDLRREVVDQMAGLRLHSVVIRTRSWSGGQLGLGAPTDTDLVLDPVPRVRPPKPHLRAAEPGKYEDGDRIVDRLSAAYTQAQLDGGSLPPATELLWLVDGAPFRVVAAEELYLQWHVHLRQMRGRS